MNKQSQFHCPAVSHGIFLFKQYRNSLERPCRSDSYTQSCYIFFRHTWFVFFFLLFEHVCIGRQLYEGSCLYPRTVQKNSTCVYDAVSSNRCRETIEKIWKNRHASHRRFLSPLSGKTKRSYFLELPKQHVRLSVTCSDAKPEWQAR